jgi:hypothetical protein
MMLRSLVVLGTLAGALAAPLVAQNRRCQLVVENVDREGVQTRVLGTSTENYFAGGNVRLRCRGQQVRIWSDSIASYAGSVVQFIGHFRYEDETAKVTSDFGTYYKDNERWDATGNVVYLNTVDGSKLEGPMATYQRRIRGVHEQEEVYADRRPTLTLSARDSTNRQEEPYIIIADRIRMRGRDLMWAGGNVSIDRTDIHGRSDSLQLDNGKGSAGALIGHASIRRAAADSFMLAGKRIDLGLKERELTRVTGRDSAQLTSKDLDLLAETIALVMEQRKVVQTLAWGNVPRPLAVADDYEVKADSLAVDTPDEKLKELRAFKGAWVGFRPDSLKGQQDYLAGDSVVATFVQRASPTGLKSTLQRLESRHNANAFYRMSGTGNPGARPSISYNRAHRIVLTMQMGDSVKVEKVDMYGNVDGITLQPQLVRRDSVRPDTTRRDTTVVRPRRSKGSR